MTEPTTEKASENKRRQEGEQEQDGARIDHPDFEGFHRFARFDRRNGHPHNQPLDQMRDHEHIDRDQYPGAPTGDLGASHRGCAALGTATSA